MQILITPAGQLRCVYNELVDLATLGPLHIIRASRVEPTAAGRWLADLSPVGGPLLGPFEHRSQALKAEHAWLEQRWVGGAPPAI